MLVTIEEIKNEYGYDLITELGYENADLTQRWVERREKEVLNYISKHAFYRQRQVDYYLTVDSSKQAIKEAVMSHIAFIIINKKYLPSMEMSRTVGEETFSISQYTHDVLENAGLLYAGARWY